MRTGGGTLPSARVPLAGAHRAEPAAEVTSPGVDRPLRRPRDFARNLTREVRLVLHPREDGPNELRGTVVASDDEQVTLEVDGAEQVVALADIDHGKVVLPW